MRKLTVFIHTSLDGFFVDRHGDMSWAHQQDAEWNAFAAENAGGGGALVFGRVTYQMMASFWPTPQAAQVMPAVAAQMNQMAKFVFSRTLTEATWQNTQLISGDIVTAMRNLKQATGPDLVILGSGSIVSQLAASGLIDAYQLVINAIVLGQGRSLFPDVPGRLPLRHLQTRTFANGNVVLTYEPRP